MTKENRAMWRTQAAVVLLLGLGLTLICSHAYASGLPGLGGGGFGPPGGLGGSAIGGLRDTIRNNIAQVASVAVLGIGLALAFAKAGWMDMVGALAFIATLGVAVSWASGQTHTFFGTGALL